MTIQRSFWSWQTETDPGGPRTSCSPNLLALLDDLEVRWPWLTNLGCFAPRPVRGSATVPSSHAYGAALDLGYPPALDETAGSHVAGFLVAWSHELHVQAIHDYRRSRIWRAGRTADVGDACSTWWKAQRRSTVTGMGQTWANHLHVETTPGGWGDRSDLRSRGVT